MSREPFVLAFREKSDSELTVEVSVLSVPSTRTWSPSAQTAAARRRVSVSVEHPERRERERAESARSAGRAGRRRRPAKDNRRRKEGFGAPINARRELD